MNAVREHLFPKIKIGLMRTRLSCKLCALHIVSTHLAGAKDCSFRIIETWILAF
jgi:hypothetical protein